MSRLFKFKLKRIKSIYTTTKFPDYDSIITLNDTDFTCKAYFESDGEYLKFHLNKIEDGKIEPKFKFKLKKYKSNTLRPNVPDYSSVVRLSKMDFTCVCYFGDVNSDLSCYLKEITIERLKKDKYLYNDYSVFCRKNGYSKIKF